MEAMDIEQLTEWKDQLEADRAQLLRRNQELTARVAALEAALQRMVEVHSVKVVEDIYCWDDCDCGTCEQARAALDSATAKGEG
jgi:cell division septum initiation protein DivIVA